MHISVGDTQIDVSVLAFGNRIFPIRHERAYAPKGDRHGAFSQPIHFSCSVDSGARVLEQHE